MAKAMEQYMPKKLECLGSSCGLFTSLTAREMKFPIKGVFSKCDQIRRKLRVWSQLLKKSLMETFFVQCLT